MGQLNIPETFELAVRHHHAGRVREAGALYQQILAQDPAHADAIHLLGVIAHQIGRNDIAEKMIKKAIAIRPAFAQAHSNLGNILREQGHLDRAIEQCRAAIALDPNFPESYSNLGAALREKGEIAKAITAFRQAIAIKEDYAHAHSNLGDALNKNGDFDEAVIHFRRAIELDPNLAQAHCNLGAALKEKGQLEEALTACRRAIGLQPTLAQAHLNLGSVLLEIQKVDEAISEFRRAIELDPAYAAAHSNLGAALKQKGNYDQSAAVCRRAIELEPALPDAHMNLGTALVAMEKADDAISEFRRAIELDPAYAAAYSNLGAALLEKNQFDLASDAFSKAIEIRPLFADAHMNLAQVLLHTDMKRGWDEYQWRWKIPEYTANLPRLTQPVWDGSDLNGRTILLFCEQGFGETIQFARYAPLVAQRGGKTFVVVPPQLLALLRESMPSVQWVTSGDPRPQFDLQCGLLDLPRIFSTNLTNIPPQTPLRPPPEILDKWRKRLQTDSTDLKVGLAWAGNPEYKADRTRSLSLDRLASLAEIDGITFYSVQKGAPAAQAQHPPAGMRLVNLDRDILDFADTAAAMCEMDLILTTDTSVAHLAGAVGRLTWLMMQYSPAWRWLRDREDSPWYPTMRLFRQQTAGDWDGVIARVAAALRDRVRAG